MHADREDFLEALASADPTPGGGSAAAHVAACAAALVAMVARVTIERADEPPPDLLDLVATADETRALLSEATTRDARAYEAVLEALRRPRSTDAERTSRRRAVQAALVVAAAVPMSVAESSAAVLRLIERLAPVARASTLSDLAVASHLAFAALSSAIVNVEVNRASIDDPEECDRLKTTGESLLDRATRQHTAALAVIEKRS
ncbi:MAG: cyclodeaminase/cyclohydrolase family protein [Candidatus Bipolaricaulota bacterium]|nr:MAG: cyclodeaminase/cyclohydrolase family protein [Candidatus Bipolaricaulota bacterium]